MLSHRAHTSTAAPSSCRRGVSQGPRLGFSSDSKRRTVPAASAQSASLLQRKTPSAGHAARSPRIDRRYRDRGRGLSRGGGNSFRPWLPSTHEQHEASPHGASARGEAARPPPQATPGTEAAARPRRSRRAPRRRRRRRGIGGARLRRPLRARRPATHEDRPEHIRLRGGQLAPRGHPGGAEQAGRPARADLAVACQGDRRDRGPPVLRPWRDRCRGHRPRALARCQGRSRRRGRLDDQPAARPQPLHLERAHRRAQGDRGVPRDEARRRVVEGAHP